VVGLPVDTARSVLTESGLSPGMAYTTSGQPGRVTAQSPGPGSSLPRGSYITLVVGRRT
jgi:beta-lactam-binding protein with PASTA domain